MGLKAALRHAPSSFYLGVKIRPRWDWKCINIHNTYLIIITMLKSDQDGIESSDIQRDTPVPIKLKSDQDGIESKHYLVRACLREPLKSDQDGIESDKAKGRDASRVRLKSDQDGIESETQVRSSSRATSPVKIRPRWDWKNFWGSISPQYTCVKIRPRWDWKLRFVFLVIRVKVMLKSDQDGIESKLIGDSSCR